jgi:hypothetical protein
MTEILVDLAFFAINATLYSIVASDPNHTEQRGNWVGANDPEERFIIKRVQQSKVR